MPLTPGPTRPLRWIGALTPAQAARPWRRRAHPARSICRNASFSCVDCGVTFTGTSYREHTSCISEAEKYQKSLYNGGKSKNKGGANAPPAANGSGASASPAPKPKPKPDTPRKKAYWEESTTDEDSSDDEGAASKKPAAKPAEAKTDSGSKKTEAKAEASSKKAKEDAAAAVSGAEQQPASEADAAPAAKPKKAKRAAEAAEEPTPKKAKAAPEAAPEATPDDAGSEKKKKKKEKKNKDKAAEGEDGASGTATASAPLTVADLVAADQLDAAISAAALDVARARRKEEPEAGPFTLGAFEAAVVSRLQWGGCTIEKKELRQRVRDQLTVDLDAAGTALLLR